MECYELGRKLGQGAMGSVYLARRKSDGEFLALKTVAVSSGHDRELAANEISILRSLQHTNIVSFYDSFVHEDEIVLVMQYCAGGDLADLIAQKRSSDDRIPDAHARSMVCQLASALAHVHANRVVHRDIKSSNVFLMTSPGGAPGGSVGRLGLEADGPGVLLGDFGVAKTLESTKAMACTQCGTPYYLPPEVCNGASYNTRADMWSLGVLVYELCALRYPFTAETLPALVMRIIRGKPPALPKHVSPEMRAACAALLQQRPRDRPSADQLLAMLRRPPPPPPTPPPGQIPVGGAAPADRPASLASSSSAVTASASLLMARNPVQRREAIKQKQKQIATAYGNPQPKRKKPAPPSRPAPGSAITAARGAPPARPRAQPSAPTRRPVTAQPPIHPTRPPNPPPPPPDVRPGVPVGQGGDFFVCASSLSAHPRHVDTPAEARAARLEVCALESTVGATPELAAESRGPRARPEHAQDETGAAEAKSVAADSNFGVPEAKDLIAEYRRRKTAAAAGRPTVLGHQMASVATGGTAPPPPHAGPTTPRSPVAQPPTLRLDPIETPLKLARPAWASPPATPAEDRDPDPDAGPDPDARPDLDEGRDPDPDPDLDRDPDPEPLGATLPKQAAFASAAQPALARTVEEMSRASVRNEHWQGAGERAPTLREAAGAEDMEVDGGSGCDGGAMDGEGADGEEVWGEGEDRVEGEAEGEEGEHGEEEDLGVEEEEAGEAWEEEASLLCDAGFMQQLMAQPWAPSESAVEEGEEEGEEADAEERDRQAQAGMPMGEDDEATGRVAESAEVVAEAAREGPTEKVETDGQAPVPDESEAQAGCGEGQGTAGAARASAGPVAAMAEMGSGTGSGEEAGVEATCGCAAHGQIVGEECAGMSGGAKAAGRSVALTGKQESGESQALAPAPMAYRAPPPLPPSAPPQPTRPPPPLPCLSSSGAASGRPATEASSSAHVASTEPGGLVPSQAPSIVAQAPAGPWTLPTQAAAASVASAPLRARGLEASTDLVAAPSAAPFEDSIGMEDIQVALGGSFTAPAPAAAADPIAHRAGPSPESLPTPGGERKPDASQAAAAARAAKARSSAEPKSFFGRLRAFFGGK